MNNSDIKIGAKNGKIITQNHDKFKTPNNFKKDKRVTTIK